MCWKESDVELLVGAAARGGRSGGATGEVLQDAVGVGVVLDVLINEENVVAMRGVVEEVRTACPRHCLKWTSRCMWKRGKLMKS